MSIFHLCFYFYEHQKGAHLWQRGATGVGGGVIPHFAPPGIATVAECSSLNNCSVFYSIWNHKVIFQERSLALCSVFCSFVHGTPSSCCPCSQL